MKKESDKIRLSYIEDVSSVFAGKWSYIILAELCGGAKRFNQIAKEINISTKSLTDALRHLEANGIINREIYPTVPVTVEYSLTEKGIDFDEVLCAMIKWKERWDNKVIT